MAMVVYTFNPSTQEAELEASLLYNTSSRTVRAAQRNPVSEIRVMQNQRHVLISPALPRTRKKHEDWIGSWTSIWEPVIAFF